MIQRERERKKEKEAVEITLYYYSFLEKFLFKIYPVYKHFNELRIKKNIQLKIYKILS